MNDSSDIPFRFLLFLRDERMTAVAVVLVAAAVAASVLLLVWQLLLLLLFVRCDCVFGAVESSVSIFTQTKYM